MNRNYLLMAMLVGVLTLTIEPLKAQSLFERRSAIQVDQYRNFAARRKGDLLTIVISESTDVENIDERIMDKTGTSTLQSNLGYGLGGGFGTGNGTGTFDASSASQRGFTGDSEFRSQRGFFDRFTVTVVDVMPNGNLLVAGERSISVQGDQRKLKLSGIVRQNDLLPNNSVVSHLVANLDIRLDGKGPEQKFGRQGWFAKKMNRYWPF